MGIKSKNDNADGRVFCPYCKSQIAVEWDDLCSDSSCPICGKEIEINYDELCDEENEDSWWWAEKVTE